MEVHNRDQTGEPTTELANVELDARSRNISMTTEEACLGVNRNIQSPESVLTDEHRYDG